MFTAVRRTGALTMLGGIFCTLLVAQFPLAAAADLQVVGAGSTFAEPVLQAWAKKFAGEARIEVLYRPVGSGEGIRRVTSKAVDFAMTDIPLTQAELSQDDLLQFPVVMGAIVPVVNLPIQPGTLKLSGQVLGDIFLGRITQWNDPALRGLNADAELPNLPIKVVHRADGSGSTFVFTHYLSKVNLEWQDRLGIGSRLHWPVGVGAEGNGGVARAVRDTPGAIGYVQLGYAAQFQLGLPQLRNHAGRYVTATAASTRAALAGLGWSRPSYYEVATDTLGEESWPIMGTSFVLIHKQQASADEARETFSFLNWVYQQGAELALRNQYNPLTGAELIRRIQSDWKSVKDPSGQAVWRGM